MRYRLRSLVALVTACGIAFGLLRGMIVEPEPYWGLYLIGLTSVCAGIAGAAITLFDPSTS
jgi:hypothetical protein